MHGFWDDEKKRTIEEKKKWRRQEVIRAETESYCLLGCCCKLRLGQPANQVWMTDWLTQWLRDLLLLLLLSCWIDVIWQKRSTQHSWTSKLFAGFSAAAAAAAVRRTSNYRRQAQTLIIWNCLQQRLWQLVRKKGGKKGKENEGMKERNDFTD